MATDLTTPLPDLSDMTLDELRAIDNPVLLDRLQRIIEDIDEGPTEIIAGFQSAI